MKRVTTILSAIALLFASTISSAQNRMDFQYQVKPASGGWFTSQSNLGGITFDYNFDLGRPVMSGTWLHVRGGTAQTWAYQTDLQFPSVEDVVATGVIARAEAPLFRIDDRGNFDSPIYQQGPAVDTGHTITFEFYSTRSGKVTYDRGRPTELTFPIVGTLNGLPLIAARDYSGEWLVAGRHETTPTNHFEGFLRVFATAIAEPTSYRVSRLLSATAPKALPKPGARIYRLVPASGTAPQAVDFFYSRMDACIGGCPAGIQMAVLWVNPDETGGLGYATLDGTVMTFFDLGNSDMRAYGDADSVLIQAKGGATTIGIREFKLFRLGAGIFNGP